jgi:predicted RNA binding protein YcfA (HicA-like mRNA interferase family)
MRGVAGANQVDGMKYRDLIRQLRDDGWQHIRTTGSHMHFTHQTKPGLVTVPAGGKLSHDIPPGTLNSILRQAGLK